MLRFFYLYAKSLLMLLVLNTICYISALEKTINFTNESIQALQLDTSIDETNLDPKFLLTFHKKIILENLGQKPLKGFYLHTNGQDFRNIEYLKKRFNLENSQDSFLKTYYWWKEVINKCPQALIKSGNPFFIMTFTGAAAPKQNLEGLAKLAAFFQIPSRLVFLNGRFAREFYYDKEWHLLDVDHDLVYQALDNHSLASFEDVLDDPFLALRTKASGKNSSLNLTESWKNFSHFDVLNPTLFQEDLILPNPHLFLSQQLFDLYPGEKLIYHCDQIPEFFDHKPHEPSMRIIEQVVVPSAREQTGFLHYHSAYPICRLQNNSGGTITLVDQNVNLMAGDSFDFDLQPLYQLSLTVSATGGNILIYSIGSHLSFPLLTKGKNILSLGDDTSSADKIQVTYEIDSKWDNYPMSQISILNEQSLFDHQSPCFLIDHPEHQLEKIWWQISSTEDFSFVIPNFEEIEDYKNVISLDLISETFLNSDENYYFRVKGLKEGVWTNWSPSFCFKVIKPEQVVDVNFEKIDKEQYKISWESAHKSDTEYLIFGSNAFDFIPSIYSDKQINAISENGIVEMSHNDNLIKKTDKHFIKVGSRYAYYRIIAKKNGIYSTPSPIIHVFDDGLNIPRNTLRTELDLKSAVQKTKRVFFPKSYTYPKESPVELSAKEALSIGPTHPNFQELVASAFSKHAYISQESWNSAVPYLLPANHPVKAKLDRLFSQRVTANSTTLKKAKFKNIKPGKFSRTIVSRHPNIKGYFLKFFSDEQRGIDDTKQLLRRVEGARIISRAIIDHHYESIMKVPGKWLYPLPPNPAPPPGSHRKNFILVAEDMRTYSSSKNKKKWKSKFMTREKLHALFTIIHEQGLADSVYAFNVPVSSDGRFAFIDTEYSLRWPIRFERMLNYLSPEMQKYWISLVESHK